jgi:hypothetical protein
MDPRLQAHSYHNIDIDLSTIIYKLNTYAIDFFYYFHLPLLFALPIYYASQCFAVLKDTENYWSAYQEWLSGTTLVTVPSTELQTFQSSSTRATDSAGVLLKVDLAWNSYLDSRLAEWKVIFTLACVFIA